MLPDDASVMPATPRPIMDSVVRSVCGRPDGGGVRAFIIDWAQLG